MLPCQPALWRCTAHAVAFLAISTAGLHGTCYATKTTKKGPTIRMRLVRHVGQGRCNQLGPSLAQPHCGGTGPINSGHAETRFRLFALYASIASDFWLCPRKLPTHSLAPPLVGTALFIARPCSSLASMKSTLLACASQMKMSEEHRRLHGHHRSSARLYSRNDTFGSLHLQRTATEAICNKK